MGKKGDALRASKKESKVYAFTPSQLEEHDRFILDQKREEIKRKLTAEMDERYASKEKELSERVQNEWNEREKMFKSGSAEDNFLLMLSTLLAIGARVLVEKFGWKPIPKNGYSERLKLARFSAAIVDEINAICSDDTKDIRRYCDDTYNKYGVRFVMEEEDDEAL